MEFNPFAPAVQQNPYPYFAHLRKHSPVYWVEPLQSWAVSRYEDVAYVAKNTQIFSSAPIIPAILGDQNPVPEVSWLISADPPEHTHLRKLVSKAFTPRMVGALEPRIKAAVVVEGHTENLAGADYLPPGAYADAEQNLIGGLKVPVDRGDLLAEGLQLGIMGFPPPLHGRPPYG